LDRDGIPLPTGPLEEPASGEVVDLRPATGRARRPALPAAELAVSSYGDVVARVAAAGEPRWLIQGLWPADAYGVLAAQEKAGKTWAALDLAVSVACGRPWLNHFACPSPGPVLVFLGEGGERATVRRIEAIATAKGVGPDQLADRLAQAGHPLKPRTIQTALGELEVAGLAQGSEEGNGRAATGHPPSPTWTPTMAATVNRAMVGERAWHDPPGNVLDRGLAEPLCLAAGCSAWARSSLTLRGGWQMLTADGTSSAGGG
jgi:hypothetical protein